VKSRVRLGLLAMRRALIGDVGGGDVGGDSGSGEDARGGRSSDPGGGALA
jgi:hypothetical protein